MIRKYFCFIILFNTIAVFGQKSLPNSPKNYEDIISSYKQLTMKQLLDTAKYFNDKNSIDTALVYYNLIINAIPKNADIEHQNILQNAYNRLANIYFLISDYRMAYDLSIKRLMICEKYNLIQEKPSVYTNIGSINTHLKQYDIAKQYYLKALELCDDSTSIVLLLNNLGANEIILGDTDTAFYYLNKSIQISKQHNDVHLSLILNNLASCYQYSKMYDSAFYYCKLSLFHSRINNRIDVEAINLSDMGKLFYELNKPDSALKYIELSNKIASENKFLKILSDNYFTLSEIEKSKGSFEKALNHYITYTNLKDSLYNAGVFGSISLIQRQYEVSKTNQQIEELVIDRQIKENTIRYQKIIWYITLGVLILVTLVLVIIFYQKRKLDKAYKILVEKNIEIVELQDTSAANKKKQKKNAYNFDKHNELLNKILTIMEDPSIYCNSDFSVIKLAELVNSNQKYVSETINDILGKNFRSFLNSYRIQEALRQFLKQDIKNFTIESISYLVGFKSSKTFWEAFKEITGVTPSYYLKSIQDKIEN